MCGSRKYPYSPHRRPLEVPRGRGVIKPELLEEKYEDKLEFSGVGGGGGGGSSKTKQKTTTSVGGVWIFFGTTQSTSVLFCDNFNIHIKWL